MSYIYENQSLRLNFNIGIDVHDVDKIVLKYRNPLGVQDEFETVVINQPPEGECYTDIVSDLLSPTGFWTFWSEVEIEGDHYVGDQFQIEVRSRAATITTLEFVKMYNGYVDTTFDFKIAALIPRVEEDYLTIRNAPFETDSQGNIFYPPGSNSVVAEMIDYLLKRTDELNNISSLSLGSYSVSYNESRGYPKSISSQIKKYVGRLA